MEWWNKYKLATGLSIVGLLLVGGITFGGSVYQIVSNTKEISTIPAMNTQIIINTKDVIILKSKHKTYTKHVVDADKRQIRQEEQNKSIMSKIEDINNNLNDKLTSQQRQLDDLKAGKTNAG